MNKLLTLLFFLAAAPLFAEEASSPTQGLTQTLVMIGIAVLFFYIILWRPEQKRRKALEAQRQNMKQGDRVTAMGIVGTVDAIQKDTTILKMVDGSKIEVLTAAITEVLNPAKSE